MSMSMSELQDVVRDRLSAVPEAPEPDRETRTGVWLMVVALWGACGIALLSVAYALARANVDLVVARVLFAAAIVAITGSAIVRMLVASTGRSERILLVAMTAVILYWVKLLHDPTQLFFADEFYHLSNAQRLAETGGLYGDNLLLPVSADYPALTVVTVALSKLTGLGLFTCAVTIIGLAKVSLAVAIFVVFERVTGSARIAGVAALLYSAHSNYVFWSAQYSYESLSVPLMAIAILCVAARAPQASERSAQWSALGCIMAVAVAITHHLTSYALVVLLWTQVLLARRFGRRPPLAMAVTATVASCAWLAIVAGGTGGYLGEIFGRLTGAVSRAVTEEAATRLPFQGTTSNVVAEGGTMTTRPPLDDLLLSGGSVLVVVLGVAAGLLVARRRGWNDPLVVVLAVAAVAAVAVYPLRLLPGAWEISNRTSDFLFLGVAFVSALAAVAFVERGRRTWRIGAVATAAVIAISGGIAIGWPRSARLPRPDIVQVGDVRISAQGPRMAQWARANLPPANVFAANDTHGRLLAISGFNRVFAGPTQGVPPLLTYDLLPQWVWNFVRRERIGYIVLDRRVLARDNLLGYFFPRPDEFDDPPISNWRNVRRKFERLPGSNRVYDSGDIVIYDIRRPIQRATPPIDG